MKRKELLKVPYLTVQAPDNPDIKYVAAAAVKKISGVKTLITDIYATTGLYTPIVRICMDKGNYENYYPSTDKWSHRMVYSDYQGSEILEKYESRTTLEQKLYIRPEDKDIVGNYTGNSSDATLLRLLKDAEDRIISNKEITKAENTKQRIHEILESLPEYGTAFHSFARVKIPDVYMYYLRKGNYAFLTCTHCGNREKYYTGEVVTLEDNARKHIEVPKKGQMIQCEFCGKLATYENEGLYRGQWTKKTDVYCIQKQQNNAVVRLATVTKIFSMGAPEEYRIEDKVIAIYKPGRITAEMLYKRRGGWQTTNGIVGYYGGDPEDHISLTEVDVNAIYGLDNMPTLLKYCGLKEYYSASGRNRHISPIRFFDGYIRNNEIEMLSKLGLTYIADIIIQRKGTSILADGKKLYDKLMIHPDRIRSLIKTKGKSRLWEIYRMEKRLGIHLPDEFIKKLSKDGYLNLNLIEECIGYSSVQKCIHYLERNKWNVVEYSDYLRLKAAAGYDMTNTVNVFPKDLAEAHQRIVDESNREANRKKIEDRNRKFEAIAADYTRNSKIFSFKGDRFIIRPAASAGEIIEEGATLHHCVGASDTYMQKHNERKSFILFLRRVEEPEIPYCTIELSPEYEVKQWFQAYDRKPDKDVIQPFIDEYIRQKRSAIC